MRHKNQPPILGLPITQARLRVEQAHAHLKAAMRILAISVDEPRGSSDDFLICRPRVDELVKVAEAIAASNGTIPTTRIEGEDERVLLLANLRDLVAAWDDSGAMLRGRFGALLDDVDESLLSELAAGEKLPNKTPARSRALRSARKWFDG